MCRIYEKSIYIYDLTVSIGTEFTERHSVCRSFTGNALSEKYNVNETVYDKNT